MSGTEKSLSEPSRDSSIHSLGHLHPLGVGHTSSLKCGRVFQLDFFIIFRRNWSNKDLFLYSKIAHITVQAVRGFIETGFR